MCRAAVALVAPGPAVPLGIKCAVCSVCVYSGALAKRAGASWEKLFSCLCPRHRGGDPTVQGTFRVSALPRSHLPTPFCLKQVRWPSRGQEIKGVLCLLWEGFGVTGQGVWTPQGAKSWDHFLHPPGWSPTSRSTG